MDKEERRKSLLGEVIEGQINSLILPSVIAITIIVVVILIWLFTKNEG